MASDKPLSLDTDEYCSIENCSRPSKVRGYCIPCYYKLLRHGTISKVSPSNRWKHHMTDIDPIKRTGNCSSCGTVKVRAGGKKRDGTSRLRCTLDANYRAKLYKRVYRQHKKDMLLELCEICGANENLCWDHCHVTDKFRGTLCSTCNTGLGMFKDSILFLDAAIKYLNKEKVPTIQKKI